MENEIDKKRYKKALHFTYKIHFKQNRKDTGIPYFTHLVSVSITTFINYFCYMITEQFSNFN